VEYAMLRDDQLSQWIDGLGERLNAGTLDSLRPFDFGDGTATLTGAQAIRVMLANLDYLDALDADPTISLAVNIRRRRLLGQFARLRDLLAAHA
jgi:hypothetical protein